MYRLLQFFIQPSYNSQLQNLLSPTLNNLPFFFHPEKSAEGEL